MSIQTKRAIISHPFLKATLVCSTLTAMIAAVLAWSSTASAGGGGFEQPLGKVKGTTTKGKVRGATTGPRSTKGDLDKDGVNNANDTDDDNDGIPDPADPRPLSPQDPDNDGVQNSKDQDDDGDGIVDTKDRTKDATTGKYIDQSIDPYNRKTKPERYEEGRANNPWKYDSDGDGRADLVEMREVLRTQARTLDISVAGSAKVLADFPKEVVGSLPEGWWNVIYDKDGDGKPASIDSDDRRNKAGAANYSNYIDNGVWEAVYKVELVKGQHKKGLVPSCDCGPTGGLITPQSTLPQFSIPVFISKAGQHSGGQTAGGAMSYKYKEFFTGGNKIHNFNSGNYISAPQFQGGTSYVTVDTAQSGGAANGQGNQSGGQWHWSGGTSGGGGGGSTATSGGSGSTGSVGSGGTSGGGGGGGACSKC